MNIAPTICNGHLSYLRGQGGEGGEFDTGVGVCKAKHLGEGRIRRLFRVHELAHRNLSLDNQGCLMNLGNKFDDYVDIFSL